MSHTVHITMLPTMTSIAQTSDFQVVIRRLSDLLHLESKYAGSQGPVVTIRITVVGFSFGVSWMSMGDLVRGQCSALGHSYATVPSWITTL